MDFSRPVMSPGIAAFSLLADDVYDLPQLFFLASIDGICISYNLRNCFGFRGIFSCEPLLGNDFWVFVFD